MSALGKAKHDRAALQPRLSREPGVKTRVEAALKDERKHVREAAKAWLASL